MISDLFTVLWKKNKEKIYIKHCLKTFLSIKHRKRDFVMGEFGSFKEYPYIQYYASIIVNISSNSTSTNKLQMFGVLTQKCIAVDSRLCGNLYYCC
jgi:hypothetical protein